MQIRDPNITRNGLLALKDSKPVPITAHSHEIIIPCVYTETVKKFMKAKGIELPLDPHKLAELRRIAKATPGKYRPDPTDHKGDEGDSHAKGTKDLKKSKKHKKGKGEKLDKEKTLVTGKNVAVARAKTSANVLQNINKIMLAPPQIPQARPSEFSMVRPFSYAAQSTPETIMHRFKVEQKEEKKEEKQDARKEQEDRHRVHRAELLDALTKRMDEVADRNMRQIRDQMVSSTSWRTEMPSDRHTDSVQSYMTVTPDALDASSEKEEQEVEQEEEHQAAQASSSSGHEMKQEADQAREKRYRELMGGVVIQKQNTRPGTLILRNVARGMGINVPRNITTKTQYVDLILRHEFGY